MKRTEDFIVEGTRLLFRNFSGREQKYNPPGKKNFCIPIEDPKLANEMKKEGWNIRVLQPNEENEEPLHYMQVSLSFGDFYPPKVYMIGNISHKKTRLNEDTVAELDNVEIESADIIIRPYNWNTPTGSGIRGYVKTLYVTYIEDVFAGKYSDYDSEVEKPFE